MRKIPRNNERPNETKRVRGERRREEKRMIKSECVWKRDKEKEKK